MLLLVTVIAIADGCLEAMYAFSRAKMDWLELVFTLGAYLDCRARVPVSCAGRFVIVADGLEPLLTYCRNFLFWLMTPADPRAMKVIAWWEKRRFFYNLALALFAAVAAPFLCVFQTDNSHTFFVVFAILLVCSNFCYTAGWIGHLSLLLITRKPMKSFGPLGLVVGTVFSFAFMMEVWIGFLGA